MKDSFKLRVFYSILFVFVLSAVFQPQLFGSFALYAFDVIFPVLFGFVLAFVINVPMTACERVIEKLFAKKKKPLGENAVCVLSFFSCVAFVLITGFFIITMMLPALSFSVESIGKYIDSLLPFWRGLLSEKGIAADALFSYIESLDLEDLQSKLAGSIGSMLSGVFSVVGDAVHSIVSVCISIVICIYVLISKKRLARQTEKLLRTYLSKKRADALVWAGSVISDTYYRFFSGQCLEACILGSISYFTFTILRIPYSALVGLTTAVFAFVPYLGGAFSFCISFFLVFITEPSKCAVFCIAYVLVQFIENQLIYPHVVGTSVGLSPLWTVISAVIGGRLFGAFGMVFFIPGAAVCARFLLNDAEKKNKNKCETRGKTK